MNIFFLEKSLKNPRLLTRPCTRTSDPLREWAKRCAKPTVELSELTVAVPFILVLFPTVSVAAAVPFLPASIAILVLFPPAASVAVAVSKKTVLAMIH
jgi:hypothetical protein